jgi:hypothetical protein
MAPRRFRQGRAHAFGAAVAVPGQLRRGAGQPHIAARHFVFHFFRLHAFELHLQRAAHGAP